MIDPGRRDGSNFTAHLTGLPVVDDAGRVVALTGTSCDVTVGDGPDAELDQAHRTTAEALTLLAMLQAEAPVGFAFVDRDLLLRTTEPRARLDHPRSDRRGVGTAGSRRWFSLRCGNSWSPSIGMCLPPGRLSGTSP